MAVWRYEALGEGGVRSAGELPGSSESEVRAALRRIGLVAIDVRPARPDRAEKGASADRLAPRLRDAVTDSLNRRLRSRRRGDRAQLHDSLATLLRSGIPLVEAIDTLAGVNRRGSGRSRLGRGGRTRRTMLFELREHLRGGGSLASGMREQPGWFDPVEVAIVEAGQHGGTLAESLARLAARHEEGSRLSQRIAGALIYPAIVAAAGVAVAMFLSVRTLPELAGILSDADVPVPTLTVVVMTVGQWLVRWGWLCVVLLVVGLPTWTVLRSLRERRVGTPNGVPRELPRPAFIRLAALADASLRLSELVRSGVPIVDALRVLAPASTEPLARRFRSAADGVERGGSLSSSLADDLWFDEEFRRLIEVAETSGELDDMLERVGRRYEREARRVVDRLSTVLEPTVILVLAVLVGTVVMAAVLPLVRLKDIV